MVYRSVAATLLSEMWLTGLHLRQHLPTTSFDIAEDSMKQALATGLIITQQKVIATPPRVTQHQCTEALVLARCICHCTVLPCKTGSQQSSCHCNYTYEDLLFMRVCAMSQ